MWLLCISTLEYLDLLAIMHISEYIYIREYYILLEEY